MNIMKNATGNQIAISVAGVIAAGFVVWFLARRTGGAVAEAAAAVGDKLNPASKNNFVYSDIVNGLGSALSGDANFDFGSYLYDEIDPNSWSVFGSSNGKLNPVSPNNIPYKATNYVGSAISGKPSFDLGIWVYDLLHGDNENYGQQVNATYTQTPSIIERVNPTSDKNFVYSGVNSLGAAITGDDGFDLGRKIYDWFN